VLVTRAGVFTWENFHPGWKFSSLGNWDSPSLSKEEFQTFDIQEERGGGEARSLTRRGRGLDATDNLPCHPTKLLKLCIIVHF